MSSTLSPVQGPPRLGHAYHLQLQKSLLVAVSLLGPVNEWINGCEHTYARIQGHNGGTTHSQTNLMSIALYWPVRMAATTAKKAKGWCHFLLGWSAYTLGGHSPCLSRTHGVGHAANEAPLSNFDNCASVSFSFSFGVSVVNGSASIYGCAYCCCRCAYKCKFKLKINRTASACHAVSRRVEARLTPKRLSWWLLR